MHQGEDFGSGDVPDENTPYYAGILPKCNQKMVEMGVLRRSGVVIQGTTQLLLLK
jgi:hypothetical protein